MPEKTTPISKLTNNDTNQRQPRSLTLSFNDLHNYLSGKSPPTHLNQIIPISDPRTIKLIQKHGAYHVASVIWNMMLGPYQPPDELDEFAFIYTWLKETQKRSP